jgi:hypothetical protein
MANGNKTKMRLAILIILLVGCFGQPLLKYQLRGMYENKRNELIKTSLINTVETIYIHVLGEAENGKHSFGFTIMCTQQPNERNCKYHNGHQNWSETNPNNIIKNTGIAIEDYTLICIDMLHDAFPDSNITKSNKNCCDYYSITW